MSEVRQLGDISATGLNYSAERAIKNPRSFYRSGVFHLEPGSVLLSHGLSHTTIGAELFHFRVRDGNGWFQLAMAARQTV